MSRAPAQPQTRTSRRTVAEQLEAARRRTLELLEPLSDAELEHQHSPIMSPLAWDLAHIGNFEELWIARRLRGAEPLRPDIEGLYDAFEHPRSERAELPLLRPNEARAYLDEVRERTLETLDEVDFDPSDPLLADAFVFGLVIQHEHQHVETMLQTLNLKAGEYPLPEPQRLEARAPAPGEALVEEGPFVLGADDEPWAYDNEREPHELDVPAFFIDAAPVTNGTYLEFVESRGYADRAAWSDDGWRWRLEAGIEHPEFWLRDGEGSWARRRFGRLEEVPLAEPVQHVSWYEADAYARWAGKRLPTESEWEKAASWDPAGGKRRFPWGDDEPAAGEANLGGARFGPAPAGAFPDAASPCGAEQLTGDVWEWTASDFRAYPGFRAFPYAEYSQVFFGPHYKVLRGGSWATHPLVARTSFRNWDFPIRRQLFVGFRCARDA